MRVSVRVNVRTRGLAHVARAFAEAGRSGGVSAPIRDMRTQHAKIYEAFTRSRFNRLSRSGGGGEWPPLAASTMRSRRGPRRGFKGPRRFSILRDTGTMFGALTIGAPGNLLRDIPGGIEYGIEGGRVAAVPRAGEAARLRKARDAGKKAKRKQGKGRARLGGRSAKALTIGQLASIHHHGLGRVPARRILVQPDGPTRKRLAAATERAVRRIIDDAGRAQEGGA